MTTFLLDQNVNKKSFARKCNLQPHAKAKRFPPEWKDYVGGFKDPQLLPIVMDGDKPLVTNDRNIASENIAYIPKANPGIIIVAFAKGSTTRTLTADDTEKILANFKSTFPKWYAANWSNTVIEITQLGVMVSHVESGLLQPDTYLAFTTANWQPSLTAVLAANAARYQRLGLTAEPTIPPTATPEVPTRDPSVPPPLLE